MSAGETRRTGSIRWALPVGAAALAGLAALGAACSWTRAEVRGLSMTPTLRPGDRVLVRRGCAVARGDLVLFRAPDGREVVKRLAGLAGDRVDLGTGPRVLGAGEVAVLGDNPAASTDSRNWGPGSVDAVRGRVVGIYHPPHRRVRWPAPGPLRRGCAPAGAPPARPGRPPPPGRR